MQNHTGRSRNAPPIIMDVPEFGKHNLTPNGWVEAAQPGKLADAAKISGDRRQPIPHNHHTGL